MAMRGLQRAALIFGLAALLGLAACHGTRGDDAEGAGPYAGAAGGFNAEGGP